MNNKKSKGKNRSKPIKTSQVEEIVIEKSDNVESVITSENIVTEEHRVPEIVKDSIADTGNEQVIIDVPKKPKRSKSKKKKDAPAEDVETVKLNPGAAKDFISATDNFTEEVIAIVPSVRKKKKKAKKRDEQAKDNIECYDLNVVKCSEKECNTENEVKLETNDIVAIENEQSLFENIETVHKDDTISKKKRKKKQCHGTEKKVGYDPCTMAFQKLVQPSLSQTGIDNDSIDIQSISDDKITKNVSEVQELQIINLNQTQMCHDVTIPEECTSKKHLSEEKLEIATSQNLIQSISNEDTIFTKNSESEVDVKEKSPKPKAKIAKPVQKNRKSKPSSESIKTCSTSHIDINYSKCAENEILGIESTNQVTNTDVDSFKETAIIKETILNVPELQTPLENVCIIDTDPCFLAKHEINKDSSISNTTDTTTNNQSQETICTGNDDIGFIEVKTGKSKKKRSKNTLPTLNIDEKIESSAKAENIKDTQNLSEGPRNDSEPINDDNQKNIGGSTITPKDLNTEKIVIPDLIEYPRSTSQQCVDDNNNNTVIQEIPTPEQIRLAIPTYIPIPTIQGSGESPEPKEKTKPLTVNITEVIPQLSTTKGETILQCAIDQSVEKNDIKSKMIEVNKDMEELRLSIERSLAELTAIEKSDTEVDKEFEELFQSQVEELSLKDTNVYRADNVECSNSNKENTKTTEEITLNENDNVTNKLTECHEYRDKEKSLLQEPDNVFLIGESIDNQILTTVIPNVAPVCPARRDKGKNKSKKKDKKGVATTSNTNTSLVSVPTIESSAEVSAPKSEETEKKPDSTHERGQQQTTDANDSVTSQNLEQKLESTKEDEQHQNTDESGSQTAQNLEIRFEPIEHFEDALTSSADDINNTFEMIVNDTAQTSSSVQCDNDPQIKIISPSEDTEQENKYDDDKKQKENPISRPKNLLGHPNIPASSNKNDFKKEKNKPPNSIQAKVKIKDSVEIEKVTNQTSKSQVDNKRKLITESYELESTYRTNMNDNLIYKYSFRKVFIQSTCHVCKKDLVHRVPCQFCSLVFYCSQKHKDEDWPQHQSLCFAVSTIAHLKEQKHIYANTQNITSHTYRLLRMQMILSCEKVLNRKLVPWEQEAILYPRICTDVKCRQWKQGQLKDCEGCGQISYCINQPDHLPQSHNRWCKSYALYQKLVNYQLTKGRLEPRLPTKVLKHYHMPEKMNDVLGSMYEAKIDMDDIQYATLTQIATAPLTAAYCHQLYSCKMNSVCANGARTKSTFTVHVVGAALPFEIDVLNKWEIFFLHLRYDIQDLRLVMVGPDLNSSKLPLDLLGKIQLCENCQINKRRMSFDFHDSESYHDYYQSNAFITPDIVCAFNSNIERSSLYNTELWPSTINCILKQRVPFLLTSYTIEELRRDLGKVRECARVDFNVVSEIKHNPFCSVRPDRNFITDHEIPLLFKNYSFCILCGTF